MPFGLWASMGSIESCVRWGPAVLMEVAMATSVGTQFAIGFVGYKFGCMIASDTLFDSGFSGSRYPMKT